VSDPVLDVPRELETAAPPRGRERAIALLGRHDFRNLYLAVAASEVGDALHYIALMWIALDVGGPLGVIAVRLADSIPALVFGLHGGVAADRFDRKRLMVGADVVRAATLVPIAVAGLAGHLPIWGLVVTAFVLETATSYFAPAYGALLPSVVDRTNVQQANALVQATAQALSIGGWALAAALLWVLPVSAFFVINAASFAASALLIARVRAGRGQARHGESPHIREGLRALRPRPTLAAAVAVIGVAVTISSGTWIGGVPILVRDTLGHGAGGFSLVMVGYAVGSIVSGVVLARLTIRRKARLSMLAWVLYLPAYGLMALAGSLALALVGAACAALAQSSAIVLVNSAAQEGVPDNVLGRVVGLISLTHRGAHATGLLFVSPLFAVFAPPTVFAAAAVALPAVGLAGVAVADRLAGRRR
jgi:MFS family permease